MPDPTPRDVVLAALVVPSPPQGVDPRPDVEWRADLIVQALTEARLLVQPDPLEPSPADLIGLAKWLAEQSRHPRYMVAAMDGYPAGWERLYGSGASEADVTVAYTSAVAKVSDAVSVQQLQRARNLLIRSLS